MKHKHNRSGVVFLITLVVLILLASLGYALTARVSAQRHRNQYFMDYQTARYACDSAYKYAFNQVKLITPRLVDRPNDPDFSDIFAFSEQEYDLFIEQYARELALRNAENPNAMYDNPYGDPNGSSYDPNDPNAAYSHNSFSDQRSSRNSRYSSSRYGSSAYDSGSRRNSYSSSRRIKSYRSQKPYDANYSYDYNQPFDYNNPEDYNDFDSDRFDPNRITIPGPYGPAWPLITKPTEIEIGDAVVTIEIEDENAKFPLVWGTIYDKETFRKAQAALSAFCEWMASVSKGQTLDPEQTTLLKSELRELARIVDPTIPPAPGSKDANSVDPNKQPVDPNKAAASAPPTAARTRSSRSTRSRAAQQPAVPPRTAAAQHSDFARLVNSSLVHTENLAAPYIKSPRRTESALKYIDRWGSKQVNINSAPRHVLEALFTMGGDGPKVAAGVIEERKIHPFKDFADLQKRLFSYSDTFQRCKDYILTESKVFTVKITAVRGIATVQLTAAVLRDGNNVQLITIVSD